MTTNYWASEKQENEFTPEDYTLPFRLVGTHEYLNAVEELSRLAKISKPDEIAVYDKILAEQREFSYFSGRMLAELNGSDYSGSRSGLAGQSSGRFKKQSLAWMLALARVELGATVAMYGHISNSFDFVAPDDFGRTEYYALLSDDVAAHLNALKTDRMLSRKSRASSDADSETIAFLRRLKIVNDMLVSARGIAGGRFANSADDFLSTVNTYRKKLSEKAELASLDFSSERGTSETRTNSKTHRDINRGSLQALSPITRACQRALLNQYGRK